MAEDGVSMREILFRAKRLDTGEWVEGFLLKVTIDGKSAYLIFGDNFCFDGSDVKALSHALVDSATVGQFTSLKDRAGKRIFEGDIVRGPHIGDDFMVEPVEFSAVCGWMPFDYLREDLSDVIGNIHDNPELLENRWKEDKHDQS